MGDSNGHKAPLRGSRRKQTDFDPLRNVKVSAGMFVREMPGKISEKYRGVKELGRGSFGTVIKVIKVGSENEEYACKCITKSKVGDEKELAKVMDEIDILKKCDHPNIMKIFEYAVDEKQIYLICELSRGGELFDMIAHQRHFREPDACFIMKQILSGVTYMHRMGVVHRDLKPENCLLEYKSQRPTIKIVDFGLSATFNIPPHETKFLNTASDPRSQGTSSTTNGEYTKTLFNDKFGTPYYIAPEVLTKSYDEKCDVWSAGVILYILIFGTAPFMGRDEKAILEKVKQGRYVLSGPGLPPASKEVKDLIRHMLCYDQEARISAADCLAHPWFKKYGDPAKPPTAEEEKEMGNVLENLLKFRGHQKLTQAVRVFLLYQTTKDDRIDQRKRMFKIMDKDGDGLIDLEEMIAAQLEMERQKQRSSDLPSWQVQAIVEDVTAIFNRLDANHNGYVELTEWLAATVEDDALFSDKKLHDAFEVFDEDRSGTVSVDEIAQMLGVGDEGRDPLVEMVSHFSGGKSELTEPQFKQLIIDYSKKAKRDDD